MKRVVLNLFYPEFDTYQGQAGYSRTEYHVVKTGLPGIDPWIQSTCINAIEDSTAQEDAIPLRVIVYKEDRGNYWRVEVHEWFFKQGWEIQVAPLIIIGVALKIVTLIAGLIALFIIYHIVKEVKEIVYGPPGEKKLPLIQIAVMVFAGAVFINAITRFTKKRK